MLEHPVADVGQRRAFAVLHLLEQPAGAQPCGQRARGVGALRGGAAVDAQQQRARRQAALELLDQRLLARVGRRRQEGREVGGESGVHDHRGAAGQRGQPPRKRPESAPPCDGGRHGEAARAFGGAIGLDRHHRAVAVGELHLHGVQRPTAGRRCAAGAPRRAGATSSGTSVRLHCASVPLSAALKCCRSADASPLSVPRIAATIAASSGCASSSSWRVRPPRSSVSLLPSTTNDSARGVSVWRASRSGAVKLSVPLYCSVWSSPETKRCSTNRASPARRCAARPSAHRARAPRPAGPPARVRPPPACDANQTSASSSQKSKKLNQLYGDSRHSASRRAT